MTTAEFLEALRGREVKLWVADGRLRYTAPAGTMTEELRAELSARKEELIQILRSAEVPARSARPEITVAPRHADLPLSFAQERFWFLDQLLPGSATYNIPTAVRLRGALNLEVLARSLTEIVRRHESLRTIFPAAEGHPRQLVLPAQPLPLAVVDLRPVPGVQAEERLRAWLREEADRPFDLERGPTLRASVAQLDSNEHVFLLTVHHIAADGWSMEILFRELTELYAAGVAGRSASLAKLPIQYFDFAQWQRQWLAGASLAQHLEFWTERLANQPAALDLPLDRPRKTEYSSRGANLTRSLPPELALQLAGLSRQQNVTQFLLMLAAFQTLLCRYTRQERFVIGSPIAGRNQPQTEGLIGCFINTLALRGDVSGDPTFLELLHRVREEVLTASVYAELPFEKLVETLHPDRSLNHTPLFQVMFDFQRGPSVPVRLDGLVTSPVPIENFTAKFDLTFTVLENESGLNCACEYRSELFDAATIGRLLGHYQVLLEGMVANPDQKIKELPLLTPAERRQLVTGWNQTATPYPAGQCVHELFAARAADTPAAVALEWGGETLTYGALNTRANQLAHHLRQRGVGPDVPVALCVERSIAAIVAMLGILKAGGAYVPLDTAYPEERMAYLLADTQAPVLVAQKKLLALLPAHTARVVCLDADADQIGRESVEELPNRCTPDQLAYVMYTSGSTGTPKGVSVPHRGIVRLVRDTGYASFGPREVFLQFAPISFDAATFEIWGALLHGARLIVFPPGTPSLEELGGTIARHGVTTLWLTAGLFQSMVEQNLEGLRSVRQLLAGGDVLSVPHVERVRRELPECRLINGYGPTENTTFTCCHQVGREEPIGAAVAIGRPIANTRVYLVDAAGQPVPVGLTGELCVGGAGLARGYWNQPALTAKKFVPDPFAAEPGARLYRTGDLARYRPDGTIEFLGRQDCQVKIRGFRIELGEIEAALNRHPAVSAAVAVARMRAPGDKRLVAYLCTRTASAPTAAELRSFLKTKLPDEMVPAAFIFLASFPLTPNGKIDRQALPDPDPVTAGPVEENAVPRTPTEEALQAIWTAVLGGRPIGIDDNFFDLGGHSLLAIEMIARLRRVFKVTLPVRCLFEAPTIAGLAERIRQETQAKQHFAPATRQQWDFLVPVQPVGEQRPFFLFPGGVGGEEEFLVYAKLARSLGLDQPFYGLKARGGDGSEAPHANVVEMAADYLKEIRAFQPDGPYLLVGECVGGMVAYEVARQLETQGQTVALLAFLDTDCPRPGDVLRSQWHRALTKIARFGPMRLLLRAVEVLRQLPAVQAGERLRYLRTKSSRALTHLGPALPVVVTTSSGMPAPSAINPLEHNYYRTILRYRMQPYRGRIVVLASEEVHTAGNPYSWKKWAGGGLEVHRLRGDHFSYIREHVDEAAKQLRACLDEARANLPGRNQRGRPTGR